MNTFVLKEIDIGWIEMNLVKREASARLITVVVDNSWSCLHSEAVMLPLLINLAFVSFVFDAAA